VSVFDASYAVLWMLFCVLAVMVLLMYRHFGIIAIDSTEGHSRDGVAVGARAPSIPLDVTEHGALSAKAHVVLFASASCGPCQEILPHFAELGRRYGATLNIIAVTPATDAEALRGRAKTLQVVGDTDSAIAQAFGVNVSPFAFLIDRTGTVQSKGIVSEVSHLRRLLREGGHFTIADELSPAQGLRADTTGGNLELL
jgi:thiol-disulfide isomerase/thioredoxin